LYGFEEDKNRIKEIVLKKSDDTIENMKIISDSTKFDYANRLIVTDLNKRIILFSFVSNSITVFDSKNRLELFKSDMFLDNEKITQLSMVPDTDDILLDEEYAFKSYYKYYIVLEDDNLKNFKYESSTMKGFKLKNNNLYLIENNKLKGFDLQISKECKTFTGHDLMIEFQMDSENDSILDYEIIPELNYAIILIEYKGSKKLFLYSTVGLNKLVEFEVEIFGECDKILSNGEFLFIGNASKNRYLILNNNYKNPVSLLHTM
jgi:hypothetical protein